MLPDVPVAAEAGYPKVLSDNWYGLIAPAATPPELQKRLHAAAAAAHNASTSRNSCSRKLHCPRRGRRKNSALPTAMKKPSGRRL